MNAVLEKLISDKKLIATGDKTINDKTFHFEVYVYNESHPDKMANFEFVIVYHHDDKNIWKTFNHNTNNQLGRPQVNRIIDESGWLKGDKP